MEQHQEAGKESKVEFSIAQQREFAQLHDTYVENEDYTAGLRQARRMGEQHGRAASAAYPSLEQTLPVPPRPDSESSREKLQKFGERDNSITQDGSDKMKQEPEA